MGDFKISVSEAPPLSASSPDSVRKVNDKTKRKRQRPSYYKRLNRRIQERAIRMAQSGADSSDPSDGFRQSDGTEQNAGDLEIRDVSDALNENKDFDQRNLKNDSERTEKYVESERTGMNAKTLEENARTHSSNEIQASGLEDGARKAPPPAKHRTTAVKAAVNSGRRGREQQQQQKEKLQQQKQQQMTDMTVSIKNGADSTSRRSSAPKVVDKKQGPVASFHLRNNTPFMRNLSPMTIRIEEPPQVGDVIK